MNLAIECGYRDRQEFRSAEEIPIASDPVQFFSTDQTPDESIVAQLVGHAWAKRILAILAIEGVGAIEVHHSMVIVYKRTDIPWDYVGPAVEKLLSA